MPTVPLLENHYLFHYSSCQGDLQNVFLCDSFLLCPQIEQSSLIYSVIVISVYWSGQSTQAKIILSFLQFYFGLILFAIFFLHLRDSVSHLSICLLHCQNFSSDTMKCSTLTHEQDPFLVYGFPMALCFSVGDMIRTCWRRVLSYYCPLSLCPAPQFSVTLSSLQRADCNTLCKTYCLIWLPF